MKITDAGIAIVEGDNYLSKDIEAAGRLNVAESFLSTFRPYIPKGGVVCDVGASLGDYTATFSDFVGPDGRVYAFEPEPSSLECLLFNMDHFPNVFVSSAAIGAERGAASVIHDGNNIGASRLVIDSKGPILVVSLDEISDKWTRLDFLKIDAEGWEPLVLDGAIKTILKFRPAMLVEINQWPLGKMGFDMGDIYERLEDLGYTFPRSDGHFADILCLPKEKQ